MFKYKLFFLITALIILSSSSSEQFTKTGIQFTTESDSEVTIPNTRKIELYSKIVGAKFNIYIQLPFSYFSDSTTVYPAVYFTDANRSFPMVANISNILSFPKGDFPEVVIIGIGYDTKGLEEWGALRTRDLTPTNVPETDLSMKKMILKLSGREIDVKSGGASLFLGFIIEELIPYIESNYRVSKYGRTLGGYSFGGLFTLYALFRKPGVFEKYFAGSPSLYYDNGVLFQYEEEYAQRNKDLVAKIFLSTGGLEDSLMISDMQKMSGKLTSRNYPSLKVDSHIFEDEDHMTCYAAAITRAFKTLFKK